MLLIDALDKELAQVPESSVLYFSGGVDSSLLACRLKRMGRKDVLLLNFAFGPHDEEARLAVGMASHLGLRCEQIAYESSELMSMLTRIGRDYSYPFGDDSTIPTNLLVHASIKALGPGRTILEGTGADGGFGPVVRHPSLWRGFYSLPNVMRSGLGALYRWLRMWQDDSPVPKLRVLSSVARQSACMQLETAAVLSSNALDGVAYCISPDIRQELAELLGRPLCLWGDHLRSGERFALLDLIYICAGRFAAKSFDPLRRGGMDPVYPFLEPGLLRTSFALPWKEKSLGNEGKILLKRLLAQDLPHDWVYRRKRAFDAPLSSIFERADVQEFYRAIVLSDRNAVLDFLKVEVMEDLIERCRKKKPLEVSVYKFLWTTLFVSCWWGDIAGSLH
jgi:asparagine synthetase B (glutamine-hydrolysing)